MTFLSSMPASKSSCEKALKPQMQRKGASSGFRTQHNMRLRDLQTLSPINYSSGFYNLPGVVNIGKTSSKNLRNSQKGQYSTYFVGVQVVM